MSKLIDLTGQRFGRLLVLYRAPNNGNNVMWHCQCDCGNEKDIKGALLKNGHTTSCGCYHKEQLSQRSIKDLTGLRSGRLVALEPTNERSKDRKVIWKCQCDCGNIAYVASSLLTSQSVKSCGCLNLENITKLNQKDITGQRFGRLIATKRISGSDGSSGGSLWECKCDCGNIIQTRIHNLTDGSTQSCGCIKSRGEAKIQQILTNNNIQYIKQKSFPTCINPITNKPFYFDFYLPDYNLLIEYDGEQHFSFKDTGWNNEENFKKTQYRDNLKNQWCLNNNIKLNRIPYSEYNNLDLNKVLGVV